LTIGPAPSIASTRIFRGAAIHPIGIKFEYTGGFSSEAGYDVEDAIAMVSEASALATCLARSTWQGSGICGSAPRMRDRASVPASGSSSDFALSPWQAWWSRGESNP
jgi:hypothetical protein